MAVSVFDQAWQSFAPAFEEVYGKTFTYRRGSLSCQIEATVGSHKIEARPDAGILESWHGHVFLFAASGLVLGGETVLPEKGDRIEETLPDGSTSTYVVMPPSEGRVYDPFDAETFQLAVYTKLVEEADA